MIDVILLYGKRMDQLLRFGEMMRVTESTYSEGLLRLREATLEAILMEEQRKVLAGESRDEAMLEEAIAKIVPDQQLEETMIKRVCARVMEDFNKRMRRREKRWREKRRKRMNKLRKEREQEREELLREREQEQQIMDKISMIERLHIHTGFRSYLDREMGKHKGELMKKRKIVTMRLPARVQD